MLEWGITIHHAVEYASKAPHIAWGPNTQCLSTAGLQRLWRHEAQRAHGRVAHDAGVLVLPPSAIISQVSETADGWRARGAGAGAETETEKGMERWRGRVPGTKTKTETETKTTDNEWQRQRDA